MKNLIMVVAVGLFSAGMNLNAQEVTPKTTTKTDSTATVKKATTKDSKTCSADEKKACSKTKKSCCASKQAEPKA